VFRDPRPAGGWGGLLTGWRYRRLLPYSRRPGPWPTANGEQRVVMGWLVPAAGYGVPAHPAHLVLEGGTSIKASDLSRLEVTVVKSGTLLSIPVQSASG
jgi:hypothetical protein